MIGAVIANERPLRRERFGWTGRVVLTARVEGSGATEQSLPE